MKVAEVVQCSFPNWYPTFKQLTFESVIVPVPASVLRYLMSDAIFVGDEFVEDSASALNRQFSSEGPTSAASRKSSQVESEHRHPSASSEFKHQVSTAIAKLGGCVFPKLNWSSPKDAAWISPGRTLKCSSLDEIFMLLKSSDFVSHDLTEPFILCDDAATAVANIDYVLVLRKWTDVSPGAEFRCFVKQKHLSAISQRYADTYFENLSDETTKIVSTLKSFFLASIEKQFPLNNYVFDVVLSPTYDSPVLLDFNPWGELTDGILYNWTELDEFDINDTKLRLVTDQTVQPDAYRRYSIPLDFLHSNLSPHEMQALSAMMENTKFDRTPSMENEND